MDALQARTLALLLGTGTASWSHASLTHTFVLLHTAPTHEPILPSYMLRCLLHTQLSREHPTIPRFPAPPLPRSPAQRAHVCVCFALALCQDREGGREGGGKEGGRGREGTRREGNREAESKRELFKQFKDFSICAVNAS